MGTMPLVPMVVSAVAPTPVLAAGGVADGRGLAAALALGADGVLLGTRFLASDEAPIAKGFKQAIVESDGHDTLVTEIPDVANGQVWPGAYVRVRRNRFIEEWIGRENELRLRRAEVSTQLREAAKAGDPDRGAIMIGQTAGLIDRVEPAADLVRQISHDAEAILRDRLPRLLAGGRPRPRRDRRRRHAAWWSPITRSAPRRVPRCWPRAATRWTRRSAPSSR
jgi:NAD(P)H-dependent flavin oxidoreductase YrpB (nitropropane dioxygenase family)